MPVGTMQTASRNGHGVSLWEATGELISAGQQVILDRVELLRSEITDDVRDVVFGVALVVAACAVASFGWVVVAGAVVAALAKTLSLEASLLIVGLPHILVGAVLAFMAIGRFRHLTRPDPEPTVETTHARA
jgi:hypothetical protein